MIKKIILYLNTIHHIKLSQLYFRLKRKLKLKCKLTNKIKLHKYNNINAVPSIYMLDFDYLFLKKFNVKDLLNDKITLLNESEKLNFNSVWNFSEHNDLWNFNLHYFEYGFSLIFEYKNNGNIKCLEKLKYYITMWIKNNPKNKNGYGWQPYTISLRLTNWISFYFWLQDEINMDKEFYKLFVNSLYEQYYFLSNHLEKDLLGNHFFENLKALILCSLFFNEEKIYLYSVKEFKKQCKEQILHDGVHFELSPMYHNIILEDIMRIAFAIRNIKEVDKEIESYLKPMLDFSYSIGYKLDRIPLFNDCGNNIAKNLNCLLQTAEIQFKVFPQFKNRFINSGYYIFEKGNFKIIVFAGNLGNKYIPGHIHNDSMSFEIFRNGKPIVVNCGTYNYQCQDRYFFRSTMAHNTVMIKNVEQNQIWGTFRVGKRGSTEVIEVTDDSITMKLRDQKSNLILRKIKINNDNIEITDNSSKEIISFIHINLNKNIKFNVNENIVINCNKSFYSENFGVLKEVNTYSFSGDKLINVSINLSELSN